VAFAATLHPLSIAGALRASATRTPQRVALVEGGQRLTYAELALGVAPEKEDAAERELILRALRNIVEYAAFDRDEVSASTLPRDTPAGAVAATVALILGATHHIVTPQELVRGVAEGRFQTAWLDALPAVLPRPAPGFRLALCEGEPPAGVADWPIARIL
jgi:hypothetical protein